jgi:hypothetical protein
MGLSDKHSFEPKMIRIRMKKMKPSKRKSGKLLKKNIDSEI